MPLISVIMGVYNSNPEMLRRSVESVLAQTLGDFELIICDDNSDEKTKTLLKALCVDSRIILLCNEENKGLAQTLNTCIEAARGEYIARQDDDDISAPERFEKQLRFFEKQDADFVGTDCILIDDNGEEYGRRTMPNAVEREHFLFNSPFIHGSMMFKKEVFAKHRYKTLGKNRKYEDYELFMRLYADGFRAANINEPLYFYRYDRTNRKIPFSMRTDEYAVRREGFRALGFKTKGFFYSLKPIMLGIIPSGILNRLRRN